MTATATTRPDEKPSKKAPKLSAGKHLRGLLPYLGRYKGAIAFGLLTLALMGFVGSVVPLATGIITDTLAGSQRPFERAMHGAADVAPLNWLSNLVPYYEPHSTPYVGHLLSDIDPMHRLEGLDVFRHALGADWYFARHRV